MRTAHLTLVLSLLLLPAAASATFSWDIPHQGSVNDMFEIEAFHTFVTNTGSQPDTVMVHLVKEMPAGWVGSLCESILCYPPFILDIDLILNPGQTTELIMDLTPVGVAGTGVMHITLTSKNNPADTTNSDFTVASSGQDVLFIFGAGLSSSFYTNAITAAGHTFTAWDQSAMGKVRPVDLARFGTVIWGSGATANSITAADMTNLDAYLAGGGHLFVSGQNLGYAYSDPGSPLFDPVAAAWFQNTLGANYIANIGGTSFVTSGGADPIFGTVTYSINGGNGANNNSSPDVFAATGGGALSLNYNTGGGAAVHAWPGAGKSLLTGFSFEGLATANERAGFMSKVLAWFAGTVTAVDDDLQPVLLTVPRAFPNPFNPRTAIHFAINGDQNTHAKITVYDVQGRAVRQLLDSTIAPGPHDVIWDGRDNQGLILAAGLYLARVQAGISTQTVKMTLAK